MKYLIKNGTLVGGVEKETKTIDILVQDSRIKDIAKGIRADDDTLVIDAHNKLIVPGLVDVHVHFREPGQTHKENIDSGSRAAAAGGFAAVIAEPNTQPPIDTAKRVERVIRMARKKSIVNFYTKACISKRMRGEKLTDMESLKKAGAVAVSDDGNPVPGSKLMEQALVHGRALDILVSPHCEESEWYRQNIFKSSGGLFPVSMPLSVNPAEPYYSETGFIIRDIGLAKKTGARIHFSHVSLAASVEAIREAKRAGIKITAEATPHHLFLTKESGDRIGNNAKVNPPLRSKEDAAALKQGLMDGTIDIVATDHAPHTPEEKSRPYDRAPFGIIGLETALGLILTHMVKTGFLTIHQAIAKMSTKPAEIFDLPIHKIARGGSPNLTIIDPDLKWKVNVDEFYSLGRNCPFDGWMLEGKAVMTIVNGRIVMKDGKIIESEDELR